MVTIPTIAECIMTRPILWAQKLNAYKILTGVNTGPGNWTHPPPSERSYRRNKGCVKDIKVEHQKFKPFLLIVPQQWMLSQVESHTSGQIDRNPIKLAFQRQTAWLPILLINHMNHMRVHLRCVVSTLSSLPENLKIK